MAKDATDDAASRKKRKIETLAESQNGKTLASDAEKSDMDIDKKVNAGTIYQRVTAYEAEEAIARDPQLDASAVKEVHSEFAAHINRVFELKSTKPEKWQESLTREKMDASLLIIAIKKLNRIEKLRNKTARDIVTKIRQQEDARQLQLQNLLCEIYHLKKEVDKCLMYKNKPLGVDLVPVKEFYASAPSSISRPEVTKLDDHQLQLARLEWELLQRKELSTLCGELDERKKALLMENGKKIDNLNSLSPLIKEVINVTNPMKEKLGLSSSYQSSLEDERTTWLPHPLYFLFVQAQAYRESSDKKLTAEIRGDVEKVKHLKAVENGCGISGSDDSDVDDDSSSEKEKTKKIELKRELLLKRHPLCVVVTIECKDNVKISLEFHYFIKLNIVTVVAKLDVPQKLTIGSGSQVMSDNRILVDLFSGDSGEESPNVSNFFLLQEVGLNSFDRNKNGSPFVWAQKICGHDFAGIKLERSANTRKDEARSCFQDIVKEIRRRVKSRLALVQQIINLETGLVTGPDSMKSVKLSCSLSHWEDISWSVYEKHPSTQHLRRTIYVSAQDLFFKATIVRGQAKMTALVAVKSSYPLVSSVFALEIHFNGRCYNALNNNDVLNIEREVNVHGKELLTGKSWESNMLVLQMYRIMVDFDIFLECSIPDQFSTEKKTFFHPFRGRTRAHPLSYVPLGEGVFLQR